MKKFGIILLVFLLIAAGITYFFRYDIMQFFQRSVEAAIIKSLPPYISVASIDFDLAKGTMEVKGFGIKNPTGYKNKYLATIDSITCRYKRKGENLLEGIEITEIVARRPLINIERLSDGRFNINEMDKVMETGKPKQASKAAPVKEGAPVKKAAPGGKPFSKVNIADLIKLTDTTDIKDGRVVFNDKAVRPSPYVLTFDDVNGKLVLKLSDDYSSVTSMSSRGSGVVNGDVSQRVDWVVSLDPRKKLLTMSNRYEVSGVDITLFKSYYDEYSPIIIKKGLFSGSLVFDFDNGNIGSMNTVRLNNLVFEEKKEGKYTKFWDVVGSDLIKYLRSSPGEVIFDFKIKGSMDNPRFYPGPIVQRAIQEMTVDKITDMLAGPKEEGAQAAPAKGGEKSDTEMVVDVLKGLFKE